MNNNILGPLCAGVAYYTRKYFKILGINFSISKNDYVFRNHKFDGNAQSITKEPWIHHTSFLWDYDMNNMFYLKLATIAIE